MIAGFNGQANAYERLMLAFKDRRADGICVSELRGSSDWSLAGSNTYYGFTMPCV